jgi:hypothetical protein
MYKLFSLFILLLLNLTLYGQINPSDSTLQVVGYWQKNDKQTLDITHTKYQIRGKDTSAREEIRYQVEVTIKDSTASGYLIELYYKNYDIKTENVLVKKMSPLFEDVSVLIQTDPYGAFQEVTNWKQIRDYSQKIAKSLEGELKAVPNAKQIMAGVEAMFNSKEAIEANSIKDALQYYTFHGAKYTLGEELSGKMQLRNNFEGKPFDTKVIVQLDELSQEEDYGIIRSYQEVDSKQLTEVTYQYLKKLSPPGKDFPTKEKFPPLSNETWTASQIHGGSGWVVYSVETKQVKADNVTNIEKRVIEIK